MCLIIDTNRLGDFFSEPRKTDSIPIYKWLKRGGKLAFTNGGKFASEIRGNLRSKLLRLYQDGTAVLVPKDAIEGVAKELKGTIRSDDPHVLALAMEANIRLLYTGDRDLMDDFKNPRIINSPRGRIYSTAANSDLLSTTTCRFFS